MSIKNQRGITSLTITLLITSFFVLGGGFWYLNNQTSKSGNLIDKKITVTILDNTKVLVRGKSYPITWESHDKLSEVSLKLKSGGWIGETIISNLSGKKGVYNWTVPTTFKIIDGRYRIQVEGKTADYEKIKKELSENDRSNNKKYLELKQQLEQNIVSSYSNYFLISDNDQKQFIDTGLISKFITDDRFDIEYKFSSLPNYVKVGNTLYFSYSDSVISNMGNSCIVEQKSNEYSCFVRWGGSLMEYDKADNYFIFIESKKTQDTKNFKTTTTTDIEKITDLKDVRLPLIFYFDANGVFPKTLSELIPTYLPERYTNIIQKEKYLYAVSENKLNYHLGVELGGNDSSELKNDKDFNSKINGYSNGFDGVDPIYDLTN